MNNVLTMQVNEALEGSPQTVLAELFRVVALKFFKHRCEGTAVHQLHEDPKTILEVKRLMASDNRVVLTQLHDTDFVLDSLSFIRALRLCEFEGK